MSRRRIFTLNDPYAMRINKELAQEIGFQESIVLLQIEHLVGITDYWFDGEPWTRATLDQLREEQFPWWSNATISRILHRLESQSLIKIANHNKAGYDRTQWFAIDLEGVSELYSVAILQPETAKASDISDCNIQADRLQYPSLQNETTIPETYERDLEEDVSNETSKKSPTSTQKVKSIAENEAEQKWEELCDSDPCGDELRQLASMAAGENKRGEKTITAVWNQVGSRYVKSREREQLSDAAWHYGFDQAISRGKPGIGYVIACAKGYSPPFANAAAPRSDEPAERKPVSRPRPVTDEEAGLV